MSQIDFFGFLMSEYLEGSTAVQSFYVLSWGRGGKGSGGLDWSPIAGIKRQQPVGNEWTSMVKDRKAAKRRRDS